MREPSQVFVLLETVYSAFDAIAKRRRVFKVETVGDCYVAVTGLPEARKDHALVMARFARECLDKFNELAKALEIKLGPDTGDLAMRIGLHSGPVTAGVLRGDKSRFQLFGDTVNTGKDEMLQMLLFAFEPFSVMLTNNFPQRHVSRVLVSATAFTCLMIPLSCWSRGAKLIGVRSVKGP